MKYPKLNTLWKRDEQNNFIIIEGEYSCPEFASVDKWHITEKIDGTNIRVIWDGKEVSFGGRTDKATIPDYLLDYLKKTFTNEILSHTFPDKSHIILFGEGYGPKIQAIGHKYRADNSFILFDVWIGGWWLVPDKVKEVASTLKIDYVPELGIMSKQEVVELVRKGFKSRISVGELLAEGIIARSHPLMLFRSGEPLMWKLKHNDYIKLTKSKSTVYAKEVGEANSSEFIEMPAGVVKYDKAK